MKKPFLGENIFLGVKYFASTKKDSSMDLHVGLKSSTFSRRKKYKVKLG
jgi:hypothetical protein